MSGLTDKLTGKANETIGAAKGDEKQEAKGKLQQALGDLKNEATKALDEVGNKVDELKKEVEKK